MKRSGEANRPIVSAMPGADVSLRRKDAWYLEEEIMNLQALLVCGRGGSVLVGTASSESKYAFQAF